MSENIATAAESLANDLIIMNSYKDFYNGKGYFLTKNTVLSGTTKKPIFFPIKNNFLSSWNKFSFGQKFYLAKLAGLDANNIQTKHYESLKNAYDKWGAEYYVVIYGGGTG